MIRILSLIALLLGAPVVASGPAAAQGTATAVFAGGCFWCVEEAFEKAPGVVRAVSGYTGGSLANPSYQDVSHGGTGHYEAVKVTYRPSQISYEDLLQVFWHNIDPFDAAGQFCDKGSSYRSAIFYGSDGEKSAALASKQQVANRFGRQVATAIKPAARFWEAEEYHQDYYKKSSVRYKFYKFNCGRAQRLQSIWGSDAGT